MGTTVSELFHHIDIYNFKKVKWGTKFNEKGQGVYVISTSNNPEEQLGLTKTPIFDDSQIDFWIDRLPAFTIDNIPVSANTLRNRLTDFWFANQNILYIGKAPNRSHKIKTGISTRLDEYFKTTIGNKSPHRGGQWLKVLKNIDSLTVYYGLCESPGKVEENMLEFFMKNVSAEGSSKFYDKTLPIPFANIKFKRDKKHNLKRQTR